MKSLGLSQPGGRLSVLCLGAHSDDIEIGAGATILGFGYLFPFSYLTYSVFKGRPAGNNPWKAKGLEWTTTSPPPAHNFDETPTVTEEAYDYASPPKGDDALV